MNLKKEQFTYKVSFAIVFFNFLDPIRNFKIVDGVVVGILYDHTIRMLNKKKRRNFKIKLMKVETSNPTSLSLCLVVVGIRTREITVKSVIETFTLLIVKDVIAYLLLINWLTFSKL